ncbi:AKAP7 2'5' RNA ligase-like domain-containing protein [Irpex lacteus]|nr:AKAP7 2'5' RNA ligase-like domain-containing protein [Irpex lacteus]
MLIRTISSGCGVRHLSKYTVTSLERFAGSYMSTHTTSTTTATPAQRGRGRGRGRGGRGRGRGRGQGHLPSAPSGQHRQISNPGLDDRILISPRRLHLTLGVMTLADTPTQSLPPTPTHLHPAQNLLTDLRPQILEKLAGHELRVGLNVMDVMRPERGDLSRAHVMWAGPEYGGEAARRLKAVCEFVHREFKRAGFVTENRPLTLHCTVINTSHRRGPRQPFSYADVIASDAFRSIERQTSAAGADSSQTTSVRGKKPIAIDLGEWEVDELQICKMGSWGPEGEYVSVGKISLK